jgi:hypothetical protein
MPDMKSYLPQPTQPAAVLPYRGDVVVLLAAEPGAWDEDTCQIVEVLHRDNETDWLVRTDYTGVWKNNYDGDFVIRRGPDGRWWTHGALSPYEEEAPLHPEDEP